MIVWARADGVEAARGSPREPEFTADTSYKIDACLSAAAQAKKNRSTQNGAKTRTTKPGGSTERFPGPHAMRRRVRRVGAAAAHSAPTRLQRCPDRAALRRCSRIRGLPDADDTPLHATDSTRHAPHPACSDPVAQC